MTNSRAGLPASADQTGPEQSPGAHEGRAGRTDESATTFQYPAYGSGSYTTTQFGTTTPYGQLPPNGNPPAGSGTPSGKPPRGRRMAGLVAVAVLAAAVGGGVGGIVGHETATPSSSVGTLSEPTPAAGDQPAGAIASVAQKVLPSVVELSGSQGKGSGVVLSAEGLILTNAHVLEAGNDLTATFQNGNTAPVQVVGRDTRADLAVVRAQGVSGLTPIQLGNSDGLQVGDRKSVV